MAVLRLSGDFGAFEEFGKRIAKAGSAATMRDIMAAVGEEAVELVREGFEKESDPYGSKWAALKYRSGRILQDTGRLRSSVHRQSATANRVSVGLSATYASFHQFGTRRMPRRAMLPTGRMPRSWSTRIRKAAQLAWRSSAGFG